MFSRVTAGPGENVLGLWSPDGKQIAFTSDRNGAFDLFLTSAGGGGIEQPVLQSHSTKYFDDWSSDGQFLVYELLTTQSDLWILRLSDRQTMPFVVTPFNETHAQFSPDGKWVAYTSDESGAAEVYVQAFPSSGEKSQVSTAGGDEAMWSRDGSKLFYITPDRKMVAVAISTTPRFRVLSANTLFSVRVWNYSPSGSRNGYVPAPDGKRFLVNVALDSGAAPIQIVTDWIDELHR